MALIKLEWVDLDEDIHDLFSYVCSNDQYLFSTRLWFNSEREFAIWIKSRMDSEFHDIFMIKENGKNIGYVHDYDFDERNGHCKIAVFIEKNHRAYGLGGLASVMFMEFLFAQYSIRKIYIDIYEYNKESLDSNLKAGFEKEGFLKDYRYYAGKYYGMYILSMTREKYENTLRRLVR